MPPPRKELSSGGQAPCSTVFLHQVGVLGTHLYQCTSWWCCEKLCVASVNFFLKTLSKHLPILWWVIKERTCPHCTECSAVFDPKWHDPHALPSLFTWSYPKWLCFPGWKKVIKWKCFADVKEVKQKMAEALKGIIIDEFKNCFEQWKEVSVGVLALNGCRTNTKPILHELLKGLL